MKIKPVSKEIQSQMPKLRKAGFWKSLQQRILGKPLWWLEEYNDPPDLVISDKGVYLKPVGSHDTDPFK